VVINLDTAELSSNDREIFKAMVERVFADLTVLEVEVPGVAASAAVAFDDEGALSSVALVPDAAVSKQPTLGQDGDVGGPAPSATSEAAERLLGEPAAGAESAVITPLLSTTGAIVDAPPPLIAGAIEGVAKVAEPSSVQPAIATEEEAPTVSQSAAAPQLLKSAQGYGKGRLSGDTRGRRGLGHGPTTGCRR
jgi:hypothetical protein